MPAANSSANKIAYKPLFVFRIVYLLFFVVCSGLLYIALKTDIERVKLDTAADFSARVQQLETNIEHFETLATVLSQSMGNRFDYPNDQQTTQLIKHFSQDDNLFSLKFYPQDSALVSSVIHVKADASNNTAVNQLNKVLKMAEFIPHILQEERIEKVSVYSRFPQAKLVYPQDIEQDNGAVEASLLLNNWQSFWAKHQEKTINWQLIDDNNSKKLSLSMSIFDPIEGLVAVVEFIFPIDIFDQEIYQSTGPESLIFLSENTSHPKLIATTQISKESFLSEQNIKMIVGQELVNSLQLLMLSIDDWVYHSDDYFMLSVPIADSFNLSYLTDAKGFSIFSSSFLPFGILLLVSLLLFGLFVDRLVHNYLTILKKQEEQLTDKNNLLTATLQHLESTQKELIHKEKIASLGGIVAGLAHQLNTPLGTAITAVSYITESTEKMLVKFEQGLKKSEFKNFLENSKLSSQLIRNNLDKSKNLVESFKMLAVEHSHDQLKMFDLVAYTKLILLGLEPILTQQQVKAEIDAPRNVELFNYPKAYAQVIVQLVNNAVVHGCERGGTITLSINQLNSVCTTVDIVDNGKGIAEEDIHHIFDPFFTSKCASQSIGLGLTIVHNLVTAQMQGEISVSSEFGHSCSFSLRLPNIGPAKQQRPPSNAPVFKRT